MSMLKVTGVHVNNKIIKIRDDKYTGLINRNTIHRCWLSSTRDYVFALNWRAHICK